MPLSVIADFSRLPPPAGTDISVEAAYRRALLDLIHVEQDIALYLYGAASLAAARVAYTRLRATTAFRDRTGNLRRGFGYGTRDTTVRIGRLRERIPDTGAAVWSVAPHSHLLESGTGPRETGRGAARGVGPATRFFTRAMEESAPSGYEAGYNAARAQFDKIREARGARGASRAP